MIGGEGMPIDDVLGLPGMREVMLLMQAVMQHADYYKRKQGGTPSVANKLYNLLPQIADIRKAIVDAKKVENERRAPYSRDTADWSLPSLREANNARQAEWCPDKTPDASYRSNELAGEVGEACNIVKKLERARHGWPGSRSTVERLAGELADVIICADLVAGQYNIDLQSAVANKFNATSIEMNLKTRLGRPACAQAMTAPGTIFEIECGADGVESIVAGHAPEPGELVYLGPGARVGDAMAYLVRNVTAPSGLFHESEPSEGN